MNNLQFEFTVDKATKTVFITKELDADLALVWDAFTKAEILDQWWAPKPFESKMIEMGFKEEFTVTLNELENLLLTLKK